MLKLQFSYDVHLPSINKIFLYRHNGVILWNVGEVYSFEHGFYISSLEHARMLIFSNYVLLAFINTIYKCSHA